MQKKQLLASPAKVPFAVLLQRLQSNGWDCRDSGQTLGQTYPTCPQLLHCRIAPEIRAVDSAQGRQDSLICAKLTVKDVPRLIDTRNAPARVVRLTTAVYMYPQ